MFIDMNAILFLGAKILTAVCILTAIFYVTNEGEKLWDEIKNRD